MDNRRLFLAILLSLAVVVIWQFLFPAAPPRRLPPPAGSGALSAPAGDNEGKAGGPASGSSSPAGAAAPSTSAGSTGASTSEEANASPVAIQPVAAQSEETVALVHGAARAQLTNRGAQLLSMTVPEVGKRDRVELVRRRSEGPYPYALAGRDLRALPLDGVLFASEKALDGQSVTFRYNGPAGTAEKRFYFDEHGFFGVEIRCSAPGWGVILGPGIGNPSKAELDSRYTQRDGVYRTSEGVQTLNPKSENEAKEIPGRALRWAGLEDNYFLVAAIPQGALGRAVFQPVLAQPRDQAARFIPVPPKDEMSAEQKDFNREFELVLQPAGERLALLSYWGSKSYELLKALPYGLEETVQLGSLGLLIRPLLAGLHWIYDHIVPNYGWAIILMTVLIKVLLLPLTHRSTLSMRKMQTLNPRMQAIRERYRPKLKDKQGRPNLEIQRKMNEEIMTLYKAEGVNPAGGCLPLLLQMPILFAFYRLLSTSVELRGAPWMLWIHDLSTQDPYFVLPIVMGVTQFLQVYMTPQAGDPAQRRLFLLMPLFMLVFFFAAPSGLVLYWLTNNILTIIQQAVYNRFWKIEN